MELQLLPLKERKQKLDSRLQVVRTSSFPSDGIRRFEIIHGRLTEMEAKIRTLEAEMAEMVERMPEGPHHARLAEMESLLAREPEWHEWRSAVGSIRDQKAQLQRETASAAGSFRNR